MRDRIKKLEKLYDLAISGDFQKTENFLKKASSIFQESKIRDDGSLVAKILSDLNNKKAIHSCAKSLYSISTEYCKTGKRTSIESIGAQIIAYLEEQSI